MNTIYGDIDKTSIMLYNDELKGRTFALLYLYEEQPYVTYKKHLQDLLCGVISFNKIQIQKHRKFCQYVELLTAILEPLPIKEESEHSFVKRHIFDAVSLLDKIFNDLLKSEEVKNE